MPKEKSCRIPQSKLARKLLEAGRCADRLGISAWLVGGTVRDLLLGQPSFDWDIVVEGDPTPLVNDLASRWNAGVLAHEQFGTFVLAFGRGRHADIATARTERYPKPGVLPLVTFSTLKDDLFRRDFAMNAIALSLNRASLGELTDLHGGLRDIELRRLRVLHPASFRDDPTRIFRLARFAGRGFRVAPDTLRQVKPNLAYLSCTSIERVREELLAILAEPDPGPALRALYRWGVLSKTMRHFDASSFPVLKDISGIALRFARLISADPAVVRPALEEYKLPRELKGEILRHITPAKPRLALSGTDLIAMGYTPGPQFKAILEALSAQGPLPKAAARRFVFDNFPPKR